MFVLEACWLTFGPMRVAWITWAYAGLVVAACTDAPAPPVRRGSLSEAYCHTQVIDHGVVDVETDYIPHVINCENGAAGFEALKALAVAARSYLYYKLDREGQIANNPGDQVYRCGRSPTPLARAAARATNGLVLLYRNTQVAGFHVAGAKHSAPECRRDPDKPAPDPTRTEPYVTYNAGRQDHEVEQTSLGMVHPRNLANRGCKSQNGAACLAREGWSYRDILRFYYGEDIEIVQAQGPCIEPLADSDAPWIWGMRGTNGILVAMALAMLAGWMVVLAGRRGMRRRRGPKRRASARRRTR